MVRPKASRLTPPLIHLCEASLSLEQVLGSRTAVYTGCFTDDYKTLHGKHPDQGSDFGAVGLSFSMLANRIS